MQQVIDHLSTFVAAVSAWCLAHPEIAWPIFTALVTAFVKPRTPEQYAAIAERWPRVAALLQLVGALGLDPVKAAKVVGKVVTGRSEPPPPPKGPSRLDGDS